MQPDDRHGFVSCQLLSPQQVQGRFSVQRRTIGRHCYTNVLDTHALLGTCQVMLGDESNMHLNKTKTV